MMTVLPVLERLTFSLSCISLISFQILQQLSFGISYATNDARIARGVLYETYPGLVHFCVISILLSFLLLRPDTLSKGKLLRKNENGAFYALVLPTILLMSRQAVQGYDLLLLMLEGSLILQLLLSLDFASFNCHSIFLTCGTLGLALGILVLKAVGAMSFAFIISMVLLHCHLFHKTFTLFPRTFSLGEGLVVCQAVSTSVFQAAITLLQWLNALSWLDAPLEDPDPFSIITMLIVLGAVTAISFHEIFRRSQRVYHDYLFYAICLLTGWGVCYMAGQKFMAYMLLNICYDPGQVVLIIWWLLLVILSLLYTWFTSRNSNATVTSTTRKYYHAAAILIFLPGIYTDAVLTNMAATGALAVFVMLEYVRWRRIKPLGATIDSVLRPLLDEQDGGCLIMTHIYLLAGCALPLSLASQQQLVSGHLSLYSGVISLGVGDSLASIVGRQCGKHRYAGSSKTVEGTLAAWISMSMCCFLLAPLSGGQWLSGLEGCVLVVMMLAVSIIESTTHQVDNLVLPLFTYMNLSQVLTTTQDLS